MDREQELLALQKRLRELGYEAEEDERTFKGRLRQKVDRIMLTVGKVATKAAIIGGALYLGDRHLKAEWKEYFNLRKSMDDKIKIYGAKAIDMSKEALRKTWDWVSPHMKELWEKAKAWCGEKKVPPQVVEQQKPVVKSWSVPLYNKVNIQKFTNARAAGIVYQVFQDGEDIKCVAYDEETFEPRPDWNHVLQVSNWAALLKDTMNGLYLRITVKK